MAPAQEEDSMGELIFLGIIVIISAIMFGMTYDFKVSILDKSGGAGLWPRIVIVFLIIMTIIRFIQVLKEKDRQPFAFLELFRGMRLFFLLALGIYIILIKPLGYIIATLLFLFITVNLFYYKSNDHIGSFKSIIIRNMFIIGFVFGLYFFFANIVYIMLPKGLLLAL